VPNTNVPDSASIRRKVLLSILTGPATLAPFLAGITALAGSWALDLRPDLGLLAGLLGVLGAGGMFLTQLLVGGEKHAARAIGDLREEAASKGERALDKLDQQLSADGDPRTEAALRDLRSLAHALDELEDAGAIEVNGPAAIEIQLDAKDLFHQCVRSLEHSLRLWHTAQQMHTKAAKRPILEQRERLLRDVFESIQQLGKLLAALQSLSRGEGSASELARVRSELDQNLEMAKQVDARLRAFEDQLNGRNAE